MSILINMEMPKNCGDCKAFVCYRQWAGDVGDCFCGITKNDAKAKEKNADCPLVPVPPHQLPRLAWAAAEGGMSMGIYIKGMDMPTYEQGDLVLRVRCDGRVDKDYSGNTVATAVPVPPHGRLIDADALKDVQQADADLFKGSSEYGEKCRYNEAINAVANIVNAPTIIEAEEGE